MKRDPVDTSPDLCIYGKATLMCVVHEICSYILFVLLVLGLLAFLDSDIGMVSPVPLKQYGGNW